MTLTQEEKQKRIEEKQRIADEKKRLREELQKKKRELEQQLLEEKQKRKAEQIVKNHEQKKRQAEEKELKKLTQKERKAEYLKNYYQNKIKDKEPAENPVGRPRKYETDDERKEEKNNQQKAYYDKNRETILAKKKTGFTEPKNIDDMITFSEAYMKKLPPTTRGFITDKDEREEYIEIYNELKAKWSGIFFTLQQFLEAKQVVEKGVDIFSNDFMKYIGSETDKRGLVYKLHLPRMFERMNELITILNEKYP